MRNKYREKLKEKFSAAYNSEIPDVKPPEEDVNRWIAIAEDRKKKKRRCFELSVGGVFNIVILLVVGVAVFPMIHDAHAGADHKLQIEEPGGDAEATSIEIYKDREDVPEEVLEEFLVFPEKFDDFEEVEIRVTKDNNQKILKSSYKNYQEKITVIYQTNYYGGAARKALVIPDSRMENWDGIEVWVLNVPANGSQKEYMLAHNNLLVRITVDKSVTKERVQKLVEQAI